MNPTGGEADDESTAEDRLTVDEAVEPATPHGDISPPLPPRPPSPASPLPARPLPRRVPSQTPNRTGPTVSPPADHTVRHLLDILKRLP